MALDALGAGMSAMRTANSMRNDNERLVMEGEKSQWENEAIRQRANNLRLMNEKMAEENRLAESRRNAARSADMENIANLALLANNRTSGVHAYKDSKGEDYEVSMIPGARIDSFFGDRDRGSLAGVSSVYVNRRKGSPVIESVAFDVPGKPRYVVTGAQMRNALKSVYGDEDFAYSMVGDSKADADSRRKIDEATAISRERGNTAVQATAIRTLLRMQGELQPSDPEFDQIQSQIDRILSGGGSFGGGAGGGSGGGNGGSGKNGGTDVNEVGTMLEKKPNGNLVFDRATMRYSQSSAAAPSQTQPAASSQTSADGMDAAISQLRRSNIPIEVLETEKKRRIAARKQKQGAASGNNGETQKTQPAEKPAAATKTSTSTPSATAPATQAKAATAPKGGEKPKASEVIRQKREAMKPYDLYGKDVIDRFRAIPKYKDARDTDIVSGKFDRQLEQIGKGLHGENWSSKNFQMRRTQSDIEANERRAESAAEQKRMREEGLAKLSAKDKEVVARAKEVYDAAFKEAEDYALEHHGEGVIFKDDYETTLAKVFAKKVKEINEKNNWVVDNDFISGERDKFAGYHFPSIIEKAYRKGMGKYMPGATTKNPRLSTHSRMLGVDDVK